MKTVLFIDRDGTLIAEPDDLQIDSPAKLRFMPGVITNLGRIAAETDFELVIVSNQDGLGTDSFPLEDFQVVHNLMLEVFRSEGIEFSAVHIDPSLPEDDSPARKPGTAMLTGYFDGYDLSNSYVIGDRPTDVQLAANLGAKAIFLKSGRHADPPPEANGTVALAASDWREIYEYLRRRLNRRAARRRTTNETDIRVEIDLDGSGTAQVATGLNFLDHMLDQLARHSSFDLFVEARGDLHIDEHHTIEDVAITLGEAFAEALGDKRGIGRYGFVLPMDDCLAQVAVDLGGRSWTVWDADFKREMIGDVPTEMFFHFFKSFSDAARCTLNIKAEGNIEHHKIEAVFKAFARAIKMAAARDPQSAILPSTKGVI